MRIFRVEACLDRMTAWRRHARKRASFRDLNLLPDDAYQNLVNQPAQRVPGWLRVFRGARARCAVQRCTSAGKSSWNSCPSRRV